MLKYSIMVGLSMVIVMAAVDNLVGETVEIKDLELPQGVSIVKYDGPPLYQLTESDKMSLAHTHASNKSWEMPEGVPRIDLVHGTILDLSGGNITKQSGNRIFNVYEGYNCPAFSWIAGVQNFGCGTDCIIIARDANSSWMMEQYHSNPYPTAVVWGGIGCQGRSQSIGMTTRITSCTNSNCCGWLSFMAYYDC
jgi:hypothetical protein